MWEQMSESAWVIESSEFMYYRTMLYLLTKLALVIK